MSVSAVPWLRNIAANVRRLRVRLGWTQEQLAEHAEIESRYVHSVEAARANPTVKVLTALAVSLGTKPASLFAAAKFAKAPPGRPHRQPSKATAQRPSSR